MLWMENWLLALVVKPFVAVALLLSLHGLKQLFIHLFPDSLVKSWLLLPVFKRKKSG